MDLKKYFLPKGWVRKKTSDDSYLIDIPKELIGILKVKRWKKDDVEKLLKINGFHIKPNGRDGTIYYVEENKLCEIFFEISAVKEFDILIFFEEILEWQLPEKKPILENEKEHIREILKVWLNDNAIKSDL